jgi:hypothetical protein
MATSKEMEIQRKIEETERSRQWFISRGEDVTRHDNVLLLLRAGICTRTINSVQRATRFGKGILGLPKSELLKFLRESADGKWDDFFLNSRNIGGKTLADWKAGAERLTDREAEYYAMHI